MMKNDLPTAWIHELSRYSDESCVWVAASRVSLSMSAIDRKSFAQRVAALELPAGKSSFFRAVFLFVQTGAVGWLTKAALAVRECGELDRVHAFLGLVWGLAMDSAETRTQLRTLFEHAGFPQSLLGPSAALADALGVPSPVVPAAADQRTAGDANPVSRVAILAQDLSNLNHPGTRMAIEHAALLRGAGVQVCVFSALELHGLDIPGWSGFPRKLAVGAATPTKWKAVSGPSDFDVVLAKGAWPHEGRWRTLAARLAGFAPDVVLFVGFFSPFMTWVWKHYPVVGLSLHTLPPLGPVDVWLHQYEEGQPLPPQWAGLPLAAPFPYAFRLALPQARPAGLAPLKLTPDSLIMVTVGYRLSREIRPQWAAQVVARLETHPQWVWLLVGEGVHPACLPAGHPRIKVLPHQDNVDGLLQRCSLYLNPPRMGGGFSVLNAMARKVPLVSRDGSDGGDKLGKWAATSDADYWQRVDQLLDDEGERARYGEALCERFNAVYNLRSALPSLLSALDEGRRHFRQRTEVKA